MHKILQLTQGLTAKISPEDMDEVTEYRWSAIKCGSHYNKIPQIYAARGTHQKGKFIRIYLHKFIASKMYTMDEMKQKGVVLTFKDGDKLNCTRENIILAKSRTRRTHKKEKSCK
jgi:predicted amidohydrolase